MPGPLICQERPKVLATGPDIHIRAVKATVSCRLLSAGIWQPQACSVCSSIAVSFTITLGTKYRMTATFCWSRFLTNSRHQSGMTEGINSLLGYLNCEQSSVCVKCAHGTFENFADMEPRAQMLQNQMPPLPKTLIQLTLRSFCKKLISGFSD